MKPDRGRVLYGKERAAQNVLPGMLLPVIETALPIHLTVDLPGHCVPAEAMHDLTLALEDVDHRIPR